MKIGILNAGGDAQGLNAVIAAAVKHGIRNGHQFVGFYRGWEGILDKDYVEMTEDTVKGITHLGGTILLTTNKGRFAGKKGAGDVNEIPAEILQEAKDNLEEIGVEALVVIGGDGSLSAAKQLGDIGVNVVGAPKSIDNDLQMTDQTFGFGTAVEIASAAIDRIHTTATSHGRVIFVETMGRHAGWIALHAGLSGSADIILIPEIPFSYKRIVEVLRERHDQGSLETIVVVAEGAAAKDEEIQTLGDTDGKPEVRLGGVCDHIMQQIDQIAPGEFEMRHTVLGHIQRGGTPDSQDRIISQVYGSATIDAIEAKEFGKVVTIYNNKLQFVPIAEAVNGLKLVTKDDPIYQTAKSIGIEFGE